MGLCIAENYWLAHFNIADGLISIVNIYEEGKQKYIKRIIIKPMH